MRILLRNETDPRIRLEFHKNRPSPFRVRDSEAAEAYKTQYPDTLGTGHIGHVTWEE